jgi:hypothetical protein
MVVLSNAFPTGVPDALCDIYFDLVFKGDVSDDWVTKWNAAYASMFEPALEAAMKTYGTPPDSSTPALPDAAYEGTYANDYLGNAVVVAEGGGLKLKLGPGGEKSFPLKHFNRDLFIYFPEAESPNMPYAVTFEIGPDKKASQVNIEDLNDDGQGVLTRAE